MAAEEPASRLERWRRHTATGAVMSAVAIGLREALEPKEEKPALVIDADADPPDDDPVTAFLVPGMPEASWVVVRPWLLKDQSEPPAT